MGYATRERERQQARYDEITALCDAAEGDLREVLPNAQKALRRAQEKLGARDAVNCVTFDALAATLTYIEGIERSLGELHASTDLMVA